MKDIQSKAYAEVSVEVGEDNTAVAVGSGSLEVFGTPCMIALMEKATVNAVAPFLENDETTVGTQINVSHCKASAVGAVITARAELIEVQGRKLVFDVSAVDDKGDVIGEGRIERFVVFAERFMSKLS